MMELYQQERFYVDGDSVTWMYFNPDAIGRYSRHTIKTLLRKLEGQI